MYGLESGFYPHMNKYLSNGTLEINAPVIFEKGIIHC